MTSGGIGSKQSGGPSSPLQLPLQATPSVLGALAEALATGGHASVDAISLESAETKLSGPLPKVTVNLAPLRLSCQELVLSRQQLGDAGCAAACGFARPWVGRLTAVRMLECGIADVGAAELSRLLLGSPERAWNPCIAGAASSLRELVLSANQIGDRGTAAVAAILPKCDMLERLLLDRNCVGPAGAAALAKQLPRSAIRELVLGSHLGGNPIGALGAEALAAALVDDMERAAANRASRLEALALEDCNIGERGARGIAKVLSTSGVTALSVARNELGDVGAADLIRVLPPSLLSLDLAGNGITDDVGAVLGQMLQATPMLSVSLAQNDLSAGLRDRLRGLLGVRLRV